MKPFHQGRKAFLKPKFETVNGHKVLKGNPYNDGTKDHKDYAFGYNKAYYDNKELLLKKEKSRAGG